MDSILKAVLAIIESRLADPSSLEGLAEVEADLLSTVTATGVIGNGGLSFWYQGKDAAATLRAAAAFDRLDLRDAAEAMRASLNAFPGSVPPQDLTARQRYIGLHREELEAKFEPLDHKIWDADHDAAAKRYVDRNRAAFVAIAPAYATLLSLH